MNLQKETKFSQTEKQVIEEEKKNLIKGIKIGQKDMALVVKFRERNNDLERQLFKLKE